MEHTQGHNLLAQEVCSFGYWTLPYMNHSELTSENFCALVSKFHMPHVKSNELFLKEFQFLISKMDPRYFGHKEGVSYEQRLTDLKAERRAVTVEELDVSLDEILQGIDLDNSILGFDLFRAICLERNI